METLKSLHKQDTCCASREMTVVEMLEQKRENLIQELKQTDDAIRNLKYINPDQEQALKQVMRLGR